MPFEVQTREPGAPTSVITLTGKLMLGQEETSQLAVLVPQLLSSGSKNLIFDLTGVTHIDSTGIGTFIDTYSRLTLSGGKMFLAGASGAVRDSFHVTRLDSVFSFYPDTEAAAAAIK